VRRDGDPAGGDVELVALVAERRIPTEPQPDAPVRGGGLRITEDRITAGEKVPITAAPLERGSVAT
jgi:hypothetical protein